MAALAYLLLPVTGLVAFLRGPSVRVRFHGLQAVAIGLVWPLALYAAATISARLTQGVYLGGAILWIGFLVGTLIGRDPKLPVLYRTFGDWAKAPAKSRGSTAAR